MWYPKRPALLPTATAFAERWMNPAAVRRFCFALSMTAFTCGIMMSPRAAAVKESKFFSTRYFWGPSAGMSSGSGGEMRANSSANSTPRRKASSVNSVTTAFPSRLSSVTLLMETCCVIRYPDVVMPLLANRMKESSVQLKSAWHCGSFE